jgi:hypothetical protein
MGNERTTRTAKLTTVSDTLSATKSVTSVYSTFEDSGISVTFTTVSSDEEILLSYAGSGAPAASVASTIYIAYEVDGGSDVEVNNTSGANAGYAYNVGFVVPVTGLTAGSHTIKLRVAKDGGTTWNLLKGSGSMGKLTALRWA